MSSHVTFRINKLNYLLTKTFKVHLNSHRSKARVFKVVNYKRRALDYRTTLIKVLWRRHKVKLTLKTVIKLV